MVECWCTIVLVQVNHVMPKKIPRIYFVILVGLLETPPRCPASLVCDKIMSSADFDFSTNYFTKFNFMDMLDEPCIDPVP